MRLRRVRIIVGALVALLLLAGCPDSGDKTDDAGDDEPIETGEDDPETEDVGPFAVHFTIISDNPGVAAAATEGQMMAEVTILNTYFVSAAGETLVDFEYDGTALYSDIDASCMDLINALHATEYGDGIAFEQAVEGCGDDDVVSDHAINVFVYDSWTNTDQNGDGSPDLFDHRGGHGRLHGNKPYILIDWKRLNHTGQAPEEHEMGHAFGLDHVCVPSATGSTQTNIMASPIDCKGRGGDRTLGFDTDQVDEILDCALFIDNELNGADWDVVDPHNCT